MIQLKSFLSLRCMEGQHIYAIPSDEATYLVRQGLAELIEDRMGRMVGKVQLTVPLDELQGYMTPPKRAPKPPKRAPSSSTGDGGRGVTVCGRVRTIHHDLERRREALA
jgi:hypothetical protein